MLVINCARREYRELVQALRIFRVRIIHCAKALVPHHEIHELAAIEFYTWACNTEGTDESVLNYTNDWLTITGRDDLMRHRSNLFELR